MSVRVYTGPHADRRRGRAGFVRLLPWALAAATILAQILWPLAHGQTRQTLTLVTVVLFFLTSASHAVLRRGWLWAAGWFAASAGIGLLAEILGVHTGLPFGSYTYADTLGPKFAGVPVVIPLAWAMMSYPALLVGRLLARGPLTTPIVAAGALALAHDEAVVHAGAHRLARLGDRHVRIGGKRAVDQGRELRVAHAFPPACDRELR